MALTKHAIVEQLQDQLGFLTYSIAIQKEIIYEM